MTCAQTGLNLEMQKYFTIREQRKSSYIAHCSLFTAHCSLHFGIINRGLRCESCVWGCWGGTAGWGEGFISVVLGFIGVFLATVGGVFGAAAFFTTVFFTRLRLFAGFLAVLGTDFLGVEGFLLFTGAFFAGIFFFAALFGAAFLVSSFMASPSSCYYNDCDYSIFFLDWL
jgi:hypothetical protein